MTLDTKTLTEITSKFRSPSGKLLLGGLFVENSRGQTSPPLYTLSTRDKTKDGQTYPSLYRLYIEFGDPIEYDFAQAYFENWAHWDRLQSSDWFKPYIEFWRRELDTKIKAKALLAVRAEAESGSRNSFAASKYLLERGWETKETKSKSLLNKENVEKIKQEAAKMTIENKRVQDDLERLKKKDE